LRPLSLTELLDRVVRLYRRHFFTFIGIIAVMQVPLTVISLLYSLLTFGAWFQRVNNQPFVPGQGLFDAFGPEYWLGLGGSLLFSVLFVILIEGVAGAAMTRAVADSALGQPVTFGEAYRRVRPALPRAIGTVLLATLMSFGLFLFALVPCVGWFVGVGLALYFSVIIVPIGIPVIVLEGRGGSAALRRAWDLVRQRFWWVLGFVGVVLLFGLVVINGPIYLLTVLFQFIAPQQAAEPGTLFTVQTIVSSVSSLALSLVYLPVRHISAALLYFDLRARFEGLDLALLASEGGGEAPGVVVAHAPAPQTGTLITGREFGYFAAFSVGGLAVFGALYAGLIAILFFMMSAALR
jgi:hypothetical protein